GVGERVVAMSSTPFARGLLEQSMTCGDRSWQEVDPRRSRGPASRGLSDFLCMTQSQDSDGQASLEVERQLVHGLAPTMWRPRPLLFGGYDPDVQHLVG